MMIRVYRLLPTTRRVTLQREESKILHRLTAAPITVEFDANGFAEVSEETASRLEAAGLATRSAVGFGATSIREGRRKAA
jgi:hypothetical protein